MLSYFSGRDKRATEGQVHFSVKKCEEMLIGTSNPNFSINILIKSKLASVILEKKSWNHRI